MLSKKGQIKSIANVSRHRDGEPDVWVDGFRSKAWERFVSNFWMISNSMIGGWNVKANTSELFGWLLSPLEKVFGLRCKRAVFTHRLRGSTGTEQKHSVIWIVNLANDWFSRELGPGYSAHVKKTGPQMLRWIAGRMMIMVMMLMRQALFNMKGRNESKSMENR